MLAKCHCQSQEITDSNAGSLFNSPNSDDSNTQILNILNAVSFRLMAIKQVIERPEYF